MGGSTTTTAACVSACTIGSAFLDGRNATIDTRSVDNREDNASTKRIIIGSVEERRIPAYQTFQVVVTWNNNDAAETFNTINLPFVETADSLASSLWPSALAGAILCASPPLSATNTTNILELGAGLGLTGQVLAKTTHASTCLLTDKNQETVTLLQDMINAANNSENDSTTRTRLESRYLEWRDIDSNDKTDEEQHSMDIVMGTDVAYYYFLLAPLLSTARHHEEM